MAFLKRGGRFIYYLITKKEYKNKPTMRSLQSSLEAMKIHCRENNVENLAMPTIGCGLDGLNWPNVSKMIQEIFKDEKINIFVYSLRKDPSTAVSRTTTSSQQPTISSFYSSRNAN